MSCISAAGKAVVGSVPHASFSSRVTGRRDSTWGWRPRRERERAVRSRQRGHRGRRQVRRDDAASRGRVQVRAQRGSHGACVKHRVRARGPAAPLMQRMWRVHNPESRVQYWKRRASRIMRTAPFHPRFCMSFTHARGILHWTRLHCIQRWIQVQQGHNHALGHPSEKITSSIFVTD